MQATTKCAFSVVPPSQSSTMYLEPSNSIEPRSLSLPERFSEEHSMQCSSCGRAPFGSGQFRDELLHAVQAPQERICQSFST